VPTILSSLVLGKRMDLTPDHGMGLAELWNLKQLEKEYFINLIHLARASTIRLKDFYLNEQADIISRKDKLNERLEARSLTEDDERKIALYYSTWLNTAVHMLTGIEQYRTPEKIAEYFSIPRDQVIEILFLLQRLGVIKESDGKWESTNHYIHISKDSVYFPMYHQQWRHQSVCSLDKDKKALNYTGLYTLAEKDQIELRKLVLEFIEKSRDITKATTAEEKMVCFSVDFFEVR
jgi:uncharacterized protein (TIGR02147 family)